MCVGVVYSSSCTPASNYNYGNDTVYKHNNYYSQVSGTHRDLNNYFDNTNKKSSIQFRVRELLGLEKKEDNIRKHINQP